MTGKITTYLPYQHFFLVKHPFLVQTAEKKKRHKIPFSNEQFSVSHLNFMIANKQKQLGYMRMLHIPREISIFSINDSQSQRIKIDPSLSKLPKFGLWVF